MLAPYPKDVACCSHLAVRLGRWVLGTGRVGYTACMGRDRRRLRRNGTTQPSGVIAPRVARPGTGQVRSDDLIARETANMIDEVKRVFLVSAVCFGMLAALIVVDRLS